MLYPKIFTTEFMLYGIITFVPHAYTYVCVFMHVCLYIELYSLQELMALK